MFHFLFGVIAVAVMWLSVEYLKKKEIHTTAWQWALLSLGILYSVFTLEVIYGFITEGAIRAALVMGAILGVFAAIWAALLARFIFKRLPVESGVEKS